MDDPALTKELPDEMRTHLHNGVDSLRVPAEYTALLTQQVTTASTAPTDTPDNGTVRVFHDGTNYCLWTRVNKTWKGIPILGSIISHVSANRSAAQAVSTGDTVVFNNETYDTLSEYDNATGIFTAASAGYYTVTTMVTSAYIAYTAAMYWGVQISTSGGNATVINIVEVTASVVWGAQAAKTVYLSAGGTVQAKVYHSIGGAQNTRAEADRVYLTIDRIA